LGYRIRGHLRQAGTAEEPLTKEETNVKIQRLAVALTLVNAAVLTLIFFRPGAAGAREGGALPVLRGSGLEIVDDRSQVRASIQLFPAVKQPNGKSYPATVLLRLISSAGRPNVKLAATDDGSGLVLGGKSDPTYIQALARGANPSLNLKNQAGRERHIRIQSTK
jgi:hypothetical protein